MEAGSRTRLYSAGATVAALFLGPNAVGVLAASASRLLRRFWTWSPSIDLELLFLASFVALVPMIVAYAFLRHRQRDPRRQLERVSHTAGPSRFLPPIEILLLQIGNVTFLTFAAVLSLIVLGSLSVALRAAVTHPVAVRNGFAVSLGLAAGVILLGLRPRALRVVSWSSLSTVWIRWSWFAVIAVVGFGILEVRGNLGFLKIDLSKGQLQPRTLAILFSVFVVCLLASHLAARVGRGRAPDRDSRAPLRWFVPAFGLASLARFGIFALFLNGVLLTLRSHLAGG